MSSNENKDTVLKCKVYPSPKFMNYVNSKLPFNKK